MWSKDWMLKILLITLSLSIFGCATGQVSIFTNPPDAEVYARPIGGGDLKLLGKTPYFISSSDMQKKYGANGPVYLEIRKQGYKNDSIYITEIARIDLAIKRELEPVRDRLSQEWLNRNVSKMFEIRRLVESKRYGEALSQIRNVKIELPLVSAVHELEGGVLLLKGDYRSAVDAYRLATKLNPENTESAKMVRYLERTYGFPKETDVSDWKGSLPESDRKPGSDVVPVDPPESEGNTK